MQEITGPTWTALQLNSDMTSVTPIKKSSSTFSVNSSCRFIFALIPSWIEAPLCAIILATCTLFLISSPFCTRTHSCHKSYDWTIFAGVALGILILFSIITLRILLNHNIFTCQNKSVDIFKIWIIDLLFVIMLYTVPGNVPPLFPI